MGPPFPYSSHKNPVKYGNGMGPAYGGVWDPTVGGSLFRNPEKDNRKKGDADRGHYITNPINALLLMAEILHHLGCMKPGK